MTGTSNRLAMLAADIRAAHADIRRSAEAMAARAIAAGHALIEAKGAMPHGAWTAWLTNNAGLSDRTAQRYMQLARAGLESATVAAFGLRAATESIARHCPPSFPLPKAGECLTVKSVFSPHGQDIELGQALFWPSRQYPECFDFLVFDNQYPDGGQSGGGCVDMSKRPVTAAGVPIILRMHNLDRAPNHPTGELRVSIDQTPSGISGAEVEECLALAAIPVATFDAVIEAHKQAGAPITAESIIHAAKSAEMLA